LKQRSQVGEAHCCADGVNRILHPGILIESQDAEEAAYFCGCRAASASHPCPKCLVAQSDLHNIRGNFELRTPQSMRAVLTRASKAKNKTTKENILKDNGMHDVEVSFSENTLLFLFLNHAYSISSGNFDFLIHTERIHMILYIPTTWESGGSICGSYCLKF
jgi:hypothetical protein